MVVAASVDANRILVDEERLILAANLIFLLNSSGLIILFPSIRMVFSCVVSGFPV